MGSSSVSVVLPAGTCALACRNTPATGMEKLAFTVGTDASADASGIICATPVRRGHSKSLRRFPIVPLAPRPYALSPKGHNRRAASPRQARIWSALKCAKRESLGAHSPKVLLAAGLQSCYRDSAGQDSVTQREPSSLFFLTPPGSAISARRPVVLSPRRAFGSKTWTR